MEVMCDAQLCVHRIQKDVCVTAYCASCCRYQPRTRWKENQQWRTEKLGTTELFFLLLFFLCLLLHKKRSASSSVHLILLPPTPSSSSSRWKWWWCCCVCIEESSAPLRGHCFSGAAKIQTTFIASKEEIFSPAHLLLLCVVNQTWSSIIHRLSLSFLFPSFHV